MDPPTPIELSLFIIFVAIFITVSISLLIRYLLGTRSSLLPPSLRFRLFSPQSLGDCAICLSPHQPKDQLRHLPLCRHAFHADCITTWLVSNKTCPLCRSPLSDADTTKETASIVEDVGHDGSRSWLRDISSRAFSFRSSGGFFTGSSCRGGTVELEAGEEISEYFRWLSTV